MKTIIIGAILLVSQDKTKVLLQLRDNKPEIASPNMWAPPGGHVENGEDIEPAAIREFKEETGYVCHSPVFVTTTLSPYKQETVYETHLYYEIYDGKQEIHCFEGQKMEFISQNELPSLKIVEPFSEVISRFLTRLH